MLPIGGKLKIGLAVFGVVLASVVGAYGLGILATPSVVGVENRFGAVNDTQTTILTDMTVHNPNPFGTTLGGLTVDYAVDMNGVRMASGTKEGVSVGKGNSTLSFSTAMNNERIPTWWVTHIRNGEHTTLLVQADIHSSLLGQTVQAPTVNKSIQTNISEAFNSTEDRPMNANQEPVVEDPVLIIRETSGQWGSVSEATTAVEMAFVIHNPKSYPVTVSEIGYNITMNGVDVGQGATDSGVVIGPGETKTVTATTEINNPALDEWWVTHLENDQVTNMTVSFSLVLDLSATGAGTVEVPVDDMHRTIETDLFGTKDEPRDGDDGGDGTSTPTDGGTATEAGTSTDGGTDSAGTDSPTPTPTPTPRPTDDGVLG